MKLRRPQTWPSDPATAAPTNGAGHGLDRSGRHPGVVLSVAASYAWRILVIGAVGYVILRLFGRFMTLVVPFSIGLLLTALLRPFLVMLRRHRVPRVLATLLATLLATVVLGGVLSLVITRIVDQAPALGNQVARLIPQIQHWLVSGPLHLNRSAVDHVSGTIATAVKKHTSTLASTAVTTGKTVLHFLTAVVLTAFITVFLLYDGEGIWNFLVRGVPRPARQRVDRAGRAAWETLGHYVRGTIIVAVFHGVVMFITLQGLAVPLATPMALIVALGSFVPLVGAVVTGALAVGMAGLTTGLVAALIVIGVLVIDSQIEAHVLQPFVVGRYVRLHPLAVVVALTAGAIVLGVFGAVVAIPTVAGLNSAVRSLLHDPDDDKPMDPAKAHSSPNQPGASEEREVQA